ncbi:MAG: hypothetical protein NUK54_06835 [Methanothrix sp.]|nr:hypothetical protein [Methanothrix sp.]
MSPGDISGCVSGGQTGADLPGSGGGAPEWWESAEGHRLALEVLQLRVRRDILKFIGSGVASTEVVAERFGIDERRAAFHLAMLVKALVVEPCGSGFRSTPTGLLYLEKVERPSSI